MSPLSNKENYLDYSVYYQNDVDTYSNRSFIIKLFLKIINYFIKTNPASEKQTEQKIHSIIRKGQNLKFNTNVTIEELLSYYRYVNIFRKNVIGTDNKALCSQLNKSLSESLDEYLKITIEKLLCSEQSGLSKNNVHIIAEFLKLEKLPNISIEDAKEILLIAKKYRLTHLQQSIMEWTEEYFKANCFENTANFNEEKGCELIDFYLFAKHHNIELSNSTKESLNHLSIHTIAVFNQDSSKFLLLKKFNVLSLINLYAFCKTEALGNFCKKIIVATIISDISINNDVTKVVEEALLKHEQLLSVARELITEEFISSAVIGLTREVKEINFHDLNNLILLAHEHNLPSLRIKICEEYINSATSYFYSIEYEKRHQVFFENNKKTNDFLEFYIFAQNANIELSDYYKLKIESIKKRLLFDTNDCKIEFIQIDLHLLLKFYSIHQNPALGIFCQNLFEFKMLSSESMNEATSTLLSEKLEKKVTQYRVEFNLAKKLFEEEDVSKVLLNVAKKMCVNEVTLTDIQGIYKFANKENLPYLAKRICEDFANNCFFYFTKKINNPDGFNEEKALEFVDFIIFINEIDIKLDINDQCKDSKNSFFVYINSPNCQIYEFDIIKILKFYSFEKRNELVILSKKLIQGRINVEGLEISQKDYSIAEIIEEDFLKQKDLIELAAECLPAKAVSEIMFNLSVVYQNKKIKLSDLNEIHHLSQKYQIKNLTYFFNLEYSDNFKSLFSQAYGFREEIISDFIDYCHFINDTDKSFLLDSSMKSSIASSSTYMEKHFKAKPNLVDNCKKLSVKSIIEFYALFDDIDKNHLCSKLLESKANFFNLKYSNRNEIYSAYIEALELFYFSKSYFTSEVLGSIFLKSTEAFLTKLGLLNLVDNGNQSSNVESMLPDPIKDEYGYGLYILFLTANYTLYNSSINQNNFTAKLFYLMLTNKRYKDDIFVYLNAINHLKNRSSVLNKLIYKNDCKNKTSISASLNLFNNIYEISSILNDTDLCKNFNSQISVYVQTVFKSFVSVSDSYYLEEYDKTNNLVDLHKLNMSKRSDYFIFFNNIKDFFSYFSYDLKIYLEKKFYSEYKEVFPDRIKPNFKIALSSGVNVFCSKEILNMQSIIFSNCFDIQDNEESTSFTIPKELIKPNEEETFKKLIAIIHLKSPKIKINPFPLELITLFNKLDCIDAPLISFKLVEGAKNDFTAQIKNGLSTEKIQEILNCIQTYAPDLLNDYLNQIFTCLAEEKLKAMEFDEHNKVNEKLKKLKPFKSVIPMKNACNNALALTCSEVLMSHGMHMKSYKGPLCLNEQISFLNTYCPNIEKLEWTAHGNIWVDLGEQEAISLSKLQKLSFLSLPKYQTRLNISFVKKIQEIENIKFESISIISAEKKEEFSQLSDTSIINSDFYTFVDINYNNNKK